MTSTPSVVQMDGRLVRLDADAHVITPVTATLQGSVTWIAPGAATASDG